MKVRLAVFHESKHMNEQQLISEEPACPFCGAEERLSRGILQRNPEVILLKCMNCFAVSASRLPTGEALDKYYESYYESSCFESNSERVTVDKTLKFGLHLSEKIIKYTNLKSLSILDFGGGDGSISLETAEQLIKKGFEKIDITIVDFNEIIVKSDDSRITITRHDTLDGLQSRSFDFIIASAVIEHIPEPIDTITDLLNLLNDGGCFYIRTPYIAQFIKIFKLLGLKWDFTFPAHIHDLGQEFWEKFFNRASLSHDFKVLESRPSIVETSFRNHFIRTLAAWILKAPWYFAGKYYKLVGGWEIFVCRNSRSGTGH